MKRKVSRQIITFENGETLTGEGNTLIRLMYGQETLHSLARGDEFDGNCPVVDCSKPTGAKAGLGALLSGGGWGTLLGLLLNPSISRTVSELLQEA
jgi:hypothetical protein